jgi:hypothetical protein
MHGSLSGDRIEALRATGITRFARNSTLVHLAGALTINDDFDPKLVR